MTGWRSWATRSWVLPWAFLVFVLLTEFGTVFLGGDVGGMLYVAFHFAINPLLGVGVAAMALIGLSHVRSQLQPLAVLGAVGALGITFIAVTGSTWLTKALGLRFR